MNNKGFTLVELLTVLVILGSLSLIVASSITASLERQDENELNSQIELAKNAAKIYFSLNGGSSVSIETLLENDYIANEKITKLDSDWCIKIENNKYSYEEC